MGNFDSESPSHGIVLATGQEIPGKGNPVLENGHLLLGLSQLL